jgi:hypothetical protein
MGPAYVLLLKIKNGTHWDGCHFYFSGISDAYSRPSDPALPGAPHVVPVDDLAERAGHQDAIVDDPAEPAEPRVAAAGVPAARADCRAVLAGDPPAEKLAAEPVRFWAVPKVARCEQVARADWVPDDSYRAFPYLVGFVRASAHWAAADLGLDDCLAEQMAADPRGPEADWGAPIPDGCSERTDMRRTDSAALMAGDHCAPAVHSVPVERSASAGSALDDSAAPTVDDHCVPADHRAQGVRSTADSAQGDSAAPMDDHCAPADHPVQGVRSTADSAQGDSAAPMDDHCALADHPVPAERSARADSVADGCSADYFPADCLRRADLPGADSRRGGRLPVVLLEPVPG